ncbi:hypothetical protein SEUCBS139899_005030 [Sporothrix eucalyptigena]|uniref:F-box/LRR-repeat protein 15-like leucin rich repeat domain-containing protein n=1 Tax=Sporothrix eucalyptigena TaxID=1812306 RepID=A0ABP0AWS9_9PEZI
MSPKPHLRSPSPVGLGRSSFSSIRERDSDLAQTFTISKISCYISQNPKALSDEVAVSDESSPASPLSAPSTASDTLPVDNNMLLLPSQHSAVDFEQTRQNDIAESVVRSLAWLNAGSKDGSLDDTIERQDRLLNEDRTLLDGPFFNDVADIAMEDVEDVKPTQSKQLFERLPNEVYRMIVDHLILDAPPNGIDRRNVDLMSLLVTSSSLYTKTQEALYRRVIVPHSRNFQKFFTQLEAHPARGEWVRRLDFSHFSPVSLFATASARAAAQNLTADTLLRCLDLTSKLQEFLVQDYIDGDVDERVLRKLLVGLPRLAALDLCGCSSVQFRNAFASIASSKDASWPEHLGIKRLSLHKCMTLASTVFDFLLPKLNRLTHLDLAGTRVTDDALMSIPKTARISHLNLAKCSLLTADGVIKFLSTHPAVNQDTLVFLSLGCDISTFQLLEAEDVSRLLPILPKTLKSLSLKGSKMDESHLPILREHAMHLEELALGRGLTLNDVSALVLPAKAESSEEEENTDGATHELRFLDISDMDAETLSMTSLFIDGLILGRKTWPLEVVEVSDAVFKRVAKSNNALHRMGWRQSEIGSRSWLVRGTPKNNVKGLAAIRGTFAMENGQRPWKMGAQSWGMRKIPVAHAKVGGMYGSYMFGRKL